MTAEKLTEFRQFFEECKVLSKDGHTFVMNLDEARDIL